MKRTFFYSSSALCAMLGAGHGHVDPTLDPKLMSITTDDGHAQQMSGGAGHDPALHVDHTGGNDKRDTLTGVDKTTRRTRAANGAPKQQKQFGDGGVKVGQAQQA